MATEQFTFTDAGDIALAPFMYREKRAEEVRAADRAHEAQRSGGVGWSGLGAEPYRGRSEADQRTAAHAAYERVKAFGESPRGRFIMALRQLEQLGYGSHVETARSAFARGFADDRRPASLRDVGAALRELHFIEDLDDGAAAVALAEATRALGEILAEQRVRKAA